MKLSVIFATTVLLFLSGYVKTPFENAVNSSCVHRNAPVKSRILATVATGTSSNDDTSSRTNGTKPAGAETTQKASEEEKKVKEEANAKEASVDKTVTTPTTEERETAPAASENSQQKDQNKKEGEKDNDGDDEDDEDAASVKQTTPAENAKKSKTTDAEDSTDNVADVDPKVIKLLTEQPVDEEEDEKIVNLCNVNNGDCGPDKICEQIEENTVRCLCPPGERLLNNECVAAPTSGSSHLTISILTLLALVSTAFF